MKVTIRAITDDDLPAVGEFLHSHLNQRVAPAEWARAAAVPWPVDAPNHGYLLDADGQIVGAHLAFYSERVIAGSPERFCNLGAWCVIEQYRQHGLRLLRALLSQDGYTFTDLSPSGAVVPLNERLKFRHLDTSTALVPALPWPSRPGRVTITSDRTAIEKTLDGHDLDIYRDHIDASAARHILMQAGDQSCYVMVRKDRRKNVPLFASILYVSDPELFPAMMRPLARHLLLRQGVLAVLAELRVVGRRPRPSVMLRAPRRKMYRSTRLRPDQIDYLYSELACVAW